MSIIGIYFLCQYELGLRSINHTEKSTGTSFDGKFLRTYNEATFTMLLGVLMGYSGGIIPGFIPGFKIAKLTAFLVLMAFVSLASYWSWWHHSPQVSILVITACALAFMVTFFCAKLSASIWKKS